MHSHHGFALTLTLGVLGGCATSSSLPPARVEPQAEPAAAPCPTPGLALPSFADEPPGAVVARLGTALPLYDRTDAVWLERFPVAINEAFDFQTAMLFEGAGAGLAARKRQQANAAKAAELEAVVLEDATRAALDRERACGVHVYALLWGAADAATLRVIADRFDAAGRLVAHADLAGATHPIAAGEGWASDALALDAALRSALEQLPDALAPVDEEPGGQPQADGRASVPDGT